jgi:hypothetical protein
VCTTYTAEFASATTMVLISSATSMCVSDAPELMGSLNRQSPDLTVHNLSPNTLQTATITSKPRLLKALNLPNNTVESSRKRKTRLGLAPAIEVLRVLGKGSGLFLVFAHIAQ